MKLVQRLLLAATLSAAAIFNVNAEIQPLDKIIAVVDKDVIMQSQLNERLAMVRLQLKQKGSNIPPEHKLREQVTERLIVESIQMQMAERAGIKIDEKTLNDAMAKIASRNNLSLLEFKRVLEADGISYSKAREQIRRELTISRVRKRQVADRIRVTDQEIKNYLHSAQGKYQLSTDYRVGHILVPIPPQANNERVTLSKELAEDIYRTLQKGKDFAQVAGAYSQEYQGVKAGDLGWRKADQLPSMFASVVPKMSVGNIAKPIRSNSGFHIIKLLAKKGEQDHVMTQYKVRHILIKPSQIRSEQQAKAIAERIYSRIKSGEDFAKLAKANSDDTGSALNGGSLNWINPDDMVPEFRNKVTATSKGTITPPFATKYGWHVMQVLDIRQKDVSSDVQKNVIRNTIRKQKYQEELQAWLQKIRDEAFVQVK
ncbi:peptidylprolyl isomerase [Zooshikella marina]|uniref:peptidylprolyl isomerase n=1 Tax=Zooshikella ganghwensis TaxID=202772 RepID=UPI001BB0AF7F|nr:peptidylprolyl isomerase [Zooshikella ganghwensis]MBU2708030.1 peptidylprolyl isomerase [Zooshikella ganghwensis]